METKKILVILDTIENKNVLIFKLTNGDSIIDLESDDSEEIKKTFLKIIKEIEINPIELELIKGKNFDASKSKLFYDASKEYIEQLEVEINELEKDENLQEIRNNN